MTDTWKIQVFDDNNVRRIGWAYRDPSHLPAFDVEWLLDGSEVQLSEQHYNRMPNDLRAMFMNGRTQPRSNPENGDVPSFAIRFGRIAVIKFWRVGFNDPLASSDKKLL